MIGKAYISIFPFYDVKSKSTKYKKRPVLVVGKADPTDCVVLPISRITVSSNIDPDYDLMLSQKDYPLMNLTATSYIRTHKQMIVNMSSLTKDIIDFRSEYEEMYLNVIVKMEEFQKSIIDNAF